MPDVGLSFTASGDLGLSACTQGEFHVNANVTSPAGKVGSATPFAISFVFYGDKQPLHHIPEGLPAFERRPG
ncbi:MAG: hypothetical protein QE285_14445 [Aquabacterium sp.]|nr:hypothetical protein [Aquabacterium sp.]